MVLVLEAAIHYPRVEEFVGITGQVEAGQNIIADKFKCALVGVALLPNTTLLTVEAGQVLLRDTLQRREVGLPADGVVKVTARLPEDGLYHELLQTLDGAPDDSIRTLRRVGDCQAPGIIATAVYEGHRYAREFGAEIDAGAVPFRRERLVIEPATP